MGDARCRQVMARVQACSRACREHSSAPGFDGPRVQGACQQSWESGQSWGLDFLLQWVGSLTACFPSLKKSLFYFLKIKILQTPVKRIKWHGMVYAKALTTLHPKPCFLGGNIPLFCF